jgi:2-C-methyl-D-erythritol 4-phosphate cytidylyltransferase
VFAGLRSVEEIVVTSPQDQVQRVERLLARLGCGKILSIIPGGKERQDSVWNGLNAFISKPDFVLVHDAVRPFVTRQTVQAVIAATKKYGAAVVGIRLQDTIKSEGRKGFYSHTLDRSKLWAVQTPQGFRFDALMKAHRSARQAGFVGTDEASLLERAHLPVRIVEGEATNIKITTRRDYQWAQMWLKGGGIRSSGA